MGISVQHVTKRFGNFVALDDVSVDIPSGSLTALLGPSGGGKTTLLRVIAGLEAPDTGVVDIAGTDVALRRAHVTMQDNPALGGRCCVGNVGLDLLLHTGTLTIDFSKMTLELR